MATKVLTLVGSLRNGSTNRQLAEATVENAPEGVEVSVYSGLENLPFYNEDKDVEGQVPAAAAACVRSGRGRRPAGGLPGVQRNHAGRAEERH